MARRPGISLDLGADLKKKEKKEEVKEEKKECKIEPDTKPASYVLPLFLLILILGSFYSLTLLGKLNVVEHQVKENYLFALKNNIQHQVEGEYSRVSSQEKAKISTKRYFEERNSVEFLKKIYSESRKLQQNYLDSNNRAYFFTGDAYSFLKTAEAKYGNVKDKVYYLPMILAMLAGLAIFFSMWKFADIYAGLISALLFLIHPLIIKSNSTGMINDATFVIPLIAIVVSVVVYLVSRYKWAFIGILAVPLILWRIYPGNYSFNNPFNDIGYFLAFLIYELGSVEIKAYNYFYKNILDILN